MLGLGTGLIYPSTIDSVIPYANSASVLFDGTNQYGDIPDSDLFSPVVANGSGFTISFWVNCVSSAANQRIINKAPLTGASGYEWQVRTDGASRPKAFFYMGGTASTKATLRIDTTLSTGTWYHIAFTWNLSPNSSAGLIGYLDGVQKTHGSGATWGTGGSGNVALNGTEAVRIARFTTNYANAYIDEISLFNDVVNSTDIGNIYNSGTPVDLSSYSNLVGYWRMGENDSVPTISDVTSNSNDMTLYNTPSIDTSVYAGA